MAVDHIRYDLLTQDAMRGVVRRVLKEAAAKGLAGEHHFFISFSTRAPGVKLSPRLRTQYPEEMTIVLQHQFWDLAVGEDQFEVGLSFNGVPERLTVPLMAIKGFFDPSVNFSLQFVQTSEVADQVPAQPALPDAQPTDGDGNATKVESEPNRKTLPAPAADTTAGGSPVGSPDKPSGGGAEVVRLDRFRKK